MGSTPSVGTNFLKGFSSHVRAAPIERHLDAKIITQTNCVGLKQKAAPIVCSYECYFFGRSFPVMDRYRLKPDTMRPNKTNPAARRPTT